MIDTHKMSPEELVQLNEILGKINKNVESELPKDIPQVRTVDDMVEDLKKSVAVTRRVKGAQRPKKMHWRTKRRKYREYYQKTGKHKRIIKRGELLSEGAEGWWKHIRGHWYQKSVPVEMTKEEWTDIVWPALKGRIPVIRRYNQNGPISVENIYIVESGTRNNILFDGKEYVLRSQGYIL